MARPNHNQPREITLGQLKQIVGQRLAAHGCIIVTISGASGSGKSTLSAQLTHAFPSNVVLHTDDYYIGKTRMQAEMPPGEEQNFDHPAAIDMERMRRNLTKLRNGEIILGAQYDMFTSEPTEPVIMQPASLIIVEGLAANSPRLRAISNLTILVKSTTAKRLKRRIERDRTRKGYDVATVTQIFMEIVEPSYQKYYAADDTKVQFAIKSLD
jgi:uridine kinase